MHLVWKIKTQIDGRVGKEFKFVAHLTIVIPTEKSSTYRLIVDYSEPMIF